MLEATESIAREDENEQDTRASRDGERSVDRTFDPYRWAAVDSPTSREAMELEDLVGVPLS